MRKKILIVFIFLFLIIPNGIVLAEDTTKTICIDGWAYEIGNWGKQVDVWYIDSEDITNQSILPSSYFSMKNDFLSMGFTIEQVDSSLATYKNNQLLNTKINTFLDKHYSTYIDSVYKSALSDSNVEKEYSFKSTYLGVSCTKEDKGNGNFKVTICPSNEIHKIYNSTNFDAAVSKITFNNDKKVFEYTISDKVQNASNGNANVSFGGNLLVRVTSAVQDNSKTTIPSNFNKNGYNLSVLYSKKIANSSEVKHLTKDGTITNTISPGETVYLEFYLKEDYSTCGGSMLGYLQFSAPTYANIDNPYNDEGGICDSLKAIDDTYDTYKTVYVPACYRDKLDYFSEIKTGKISEATIRADIAKLKGIIEDWEISETSLTQLTCHYNPERKSELSANGQSYSYNITNTENMEKVISQKKYVYKPSGYEYWAADCTETLTVLYDQPKQVIAGAGFPYVARIEVERVCTPILLKKVESPPACDYGIECYGGLPGNVHNGSSGAGPSEDFDNCVSTCDGGKYTKKCINSCYNLVYKGEENSVDKTFSFLDVARVQNLNLVNDSENVLLTKVAAETTPRGNEKTDRTFRSNRDSGCSPSKQSCSITHPNGSVSEFPFASQCVNEGVVCYEVKLSSSDCGGSNEDGKKASMDEYEDLVDALEVYTTQETSQMSIIDSYKENESKTDLLKTTWKSDGLLNSEKTLTSSTATTTKKIDYADDDSINVPTSITVTKEYEVNIPKAYVTIISEGTNEQSVRYTKQDAASESGERDGGNNYYTDVNSGVYNNYKTETGWNIGLSHKYDDNAKKNDDKLGNNINVTFKNIGTLRSTEDGKDEYTWETVNINCFYGVYNQIKIECEEPICPDPDNPPLYIPDCPEGDVCTFGLQYMFRQVNLTDLFPDRNPRWNWNYTTKIGASYMSNASEIIKDIETTGNNAYSHEPEYEFVITRENIRAIRDYNDGKTYQMYDDMTCDTVANSGIKVCKSGFLDEYVSELTRNTTLGQNTDKNG